MSTGFKGGALEIDDPATSRANLEIPPSFSPISFTAHLNADTTGGVTGNGNAYTIGSGIAQPPLVIDDESVPGMVSTLGVFTVPVAGWYEFYGQCTFGGWSDASGVNRTSGNVVINNTTHYSNPSPITGRDNSLFRIEAIGKMIYLNIGDTVVFTFSSQGDASNDTLNAVAQVPGIKRTFISGFLIHL